MPGALVAHTTTVAGATSSGINTSTATLLLAIVAFDRSEFVSSPLKPTVADSNSNTWELATLAQEAEFPASIILYAWNPTVGSGHTFSCTISGGGGTHVTSFLAVSGIRTTSDPLSFTNAASGSGASSGQAGSCSPTANGFVVAGWASGGADKSGSIAIDSGFTLDDVMPASGTYNGASAHFVPTSTTAVNPTWSWTETGSGRWAATIAAFAPSAATVYTLTASPGAIAFAGAAATLSLTRAITASPGSITYDGATATLTKTSAGVFTLTASPGNLTYAGAEATLTYLQAYRLTAAAGNMTYAGAAANLSWSGEPSVISGGGGFALGGGGRRLAREVDELEYIKEIEKRLKSGTALRAAIQELKKSPEPKVRQEAVRVEKKALRGKPETRRWVAEQLRQIETRNIIARPVEEDFTEEIEAVLAEERRIVKQVLSILERYDD